jgi:hypothetical protein
MTTIVGYLVVLDEPVSPLGEQLPLERALREFRGVARVLPVATENGLAEAAAVLRTRTDAAERLFGLGRALLDLQAHPDDSPRRR